MSVSSVESVAAHSSRASLNHCAELVDAHRRVCVRHRRSATVAVRWNRVDSSAVGSDSVLVEYARWNQHTTDGAAIGIVAETSTFFPA